MTRKVGISFVIRLPTRSPFSLGAAARAKEVDTFFAIPPALFLLCELRADLIYKYKDITLVWLLILGHAEYLPKIITTFAYCIEMLLAAFVV